MSEPDSNEDILVELTDAAHTYGVGANAVVAVRGVTATVRAGDRIVLVGRSGSGKSTLLHMMAGLEPVTSGGIRWPMFDGSPLGRPRLAAVVFQGPTLVPTLTAQHNVALPLLLDGVPETRARELAGASLDLLSLSWAVDRLPEQLSGGQAQRVAVARVLCAGPSLILADEPTGQLDRATAGRVVDALFTAADRLGAALVVATHDTELAERFSTRWTMTDGVVALPWAVAR